MGETGKIGDLGEFGLISLIQQGAVVDGRDVIKGIGDDCAVLRAMASGCVQLFTADMLVEQVHFTRLIAPADIGYKSIACNISDIAAMGGCPEHCLISLALPRNTETGFVAGLYEGMKQACREYRVNIIGGDTVASCQGVVINVAMTGSVDAGKVIYRSGACAGNIIGVSGRPGMAAAGLDLLNAGVAFANAAKYIRKHCRPEPRPLLGQALAENGATALNDVSDGLAGELNEIAAASNTGLLVDRRLLPLVEPEKDIAGYLRRSPLEYALYGGEDYELLFTMDYDRYLEIDARLRQQITIIGSVTDEFSGVRLMDESGTEILDCKGYNHFG